MFLILHGAVIGWVLLGCAMLCGALIRRATPRVRARNAALAGLAAIAMSYGMSRVLLATTALRLEGTGAWVAVQVAATSPLRSRALARARVVLAARITRNIPPPVAGEDTFARDALTIDGPPVDEESIARYRALSTSDDCVDTTTFLAGVTLHAPAATNAAVDTAVGCGRKNDAAQIAEHRFIATDFVDASRVYDRVALTWRPDDPDDPFAAPLLGLRYRNEALTHFLAGDLGHLAKTLERYRSVAPHAERVDCAIAAIAALQGDAQARAKLAAGTDPACTLALAAVTDRSARAPFFKTLEHNERRYEHLALIDAWKADALLEPTASWTQVDLDTAQYRFHAHTLLVFPYAARLEQPAPIFETLARLDAMGDLTMPLRLARARYRSMAARFESTIAEDAAARRRIADALEDYRVLAERLSPKSYEATSLEAERAEAFELAAAIALVAGDVEGADAFLRALPAWIERPPAEDAFAVRAARASTHALMGYVALFRGDAAPLDRFARSAECGELSDCVVVLPGALAALRAATSGDARGCDGVACLVAARQPSARAALFAHVDQDIGFMAIEHTPLDRLAALGRARRLALAIGDTRYDAAFARWLSVLRPRTLDARSAALSAELTGRLF